MPEKVDPESLVLVGSFDQAGNIRNYYLLVITLRGLQGSAKAS